MTQNRSQKVVVVGRGAAGSAATATLLRSGWHGEVVVVDGEAGGGYNRTLVNKGILPGLLTSPQIALRPVEGVTEVLDRAIRIDVGQRMLRLESGTTLPFDALILATGSRARGWPGAVESARVTALHSPDDAIRAAALLDGGSRSVTILGAGLVGAETASILTERGIYVALVARSTAPLAGVLGMEIAAQIRELHAEHVDTFFGQDVNAIEADADSATVTLEGGHRLRSDVVIVAHGTRPDVDWIGGTAESLTTDRRLRWDAAARIYAAGGMAAYLTHDGSRLRVDHWEDAAAQGVHAAAVALHDLGCGDDPGPYQSVAGYSLRLYGHTVTAFGVPLPGDHETPAGRTGLVNQFEGAAGVSAVIGFDAVSVVRTVAGEVGLR